MNTKESLDVWDNIFRIHFAYIADYLEPNDDYYHNVDILTITIITLIGLLEKHINLLRKHIGLKKLKIKKIILK